MSLGNVLLSQCTEGDCINGYGVVIDSEGRYTGYFKNGLKLPHDCRNNWIRLTLSSNSLEQEYIKEILDEE